MNLKKIVILIVPFLIVPFMLSVITTAEENLTDVSPLSTDVIESVMHPETQHLAADVLRICKEENISAEFIVSVMRWERRPDLHNWFGWTNSNGKLIKFESDIACLDGALYIIPKPLLEYRISEGQVSRVHNQQQIETAGRIRNELLNFLIKKKSHCYVEHLKKLFKAYVLLNKKRFIYI